MKFTWEIDRKIQSDNMLAFMGYIGFFYTHLDIFSYFRKGFFFILYKENKKIE